MQSQLQPLFNIKINNNDVTHDVDGSVEYDERADQITTLTFGLKRGAYYLEVVKPGQKVVFFGGTTVKVRTIFTGIIKKIVSKFPDEGDVTISLICYDTLWGEATNSRRQFVYPQRNSLRRWADKETLKVSEIVTNIAQEMGAEVYISLPPHADDKPYTLKQPANQVYRDGNGMTDWAFLRQLAKYYKCYVWTDIQGQDLVINFVDMSQVTNFSSKISFVYPLREGNDFVQTQIVPNQFIIRGVEVDEDVQAADANLRTVTKFDDATGDQLTMISKTVEKDGKNYIYYYQLNEQKVKDLEDKDPKEADRLRNMGIFNIPPKEFLKYYSTVEYVEDNVAVFSQIFIGITLTCTSDGNIDIHSQQAYDVHGIARYSTNERFGKYYLRALKMRWDDDGFTNEYEFMR